VTKLLSRLRRSHPGLDVLSGCAEEDSRAAAESALATHLAACAECQSRIEELRDVRVALRSTPAADVPRPFRLRLADVESSAAARTPSYGAGVLRLMPAMSALAVVLFAALVGADWLANRDGGSASFSARALNDSPRTAASNAPAAAPASPQAASKSEAGVGAATPTALTSALAPGAAAAPTAGERQAAPGAADMAAPPIGTAPGTFVSPSPSSTEAAQAYDAAQGGQPPRVPEARDTQVAPPATDDGWSALRIAEVILAGLAIVTGGIAAWRWMRSREVT
jgi:hypothetical protein